VVTPSLEHVKIEQAAFFIAGKRDLVFSFAGAGLLATMDQWAPKLRWLGDQRGWPLGACQHHTFTDEALLAF
jgi:hypothetical protein